jgi:uncharacterized protein
MLTMAISMYSASVPVFVRMLGNLSSWLDKAETHAAAHHFEPQVLVNARLYPDMLPLSAQVQIACDSAKAAVARLAGLEAPRHEDTEQTFAELRARIAKTLDFVRSVPAAQIDGSEARVISIPRRNKDPLKLQGEVYLRHYALSNLYFHVTTAYAILRHNGIEVGKGDYLGILPGDQVPS